MRSTRQAYGRLAEPVEIVTYLGGDEHQDVVGGLLRVLDDDVEIPLVVEHSGVEQFVVLVDVLTVVALAARESEHPLFEDRLGAVPQRALGAAVGSSTIPAMPVLAPPVTNRGRTSRRSTCSRRSGSATPRAGDMRSPSRPSRPSTGARGIGAARASHDELGEWVFCADASAALPFCETETNNQRLFGTPNALRYVKTGSTTSSSTASPGPSIPSGPAPRWRPTNVLELAPGGSAQVRIRLTATTGTGIPTADPPARGSIAS